MMGKALCMNRVVVMSLNKAKSQRAISYNIQTEVQNKKKKEEKTKNSDKYRRRLRKEQQLGEPEPREDERHEGQQDPPHLNGKAAAEPPVQQAGRTAMDAGTGIVDEAAEVGTALALDVFAAAFHEEAELSANKRRSTNKRSGWGERREKGARRERKTSEARTEELTEHCRGRSGDRCRDHSGCRWGNRGGGGGGT